MDFGLFREFEKRNYIPNNTNIYYAYEMLVEGLTVLCHNKGTEPNWLDCYDKIVDWLKDNKGKGIMVRGDMGTGKSLICRDIIPRILYTKDENNNQYFVNSYDAYDLQRTPTEEMCLRNFVILDDIGVEGEYNHYGTKRNIFSEIVDHAEQHNTILIITSNLTLEQIKEKYGTRTFDRLKALVADVRFTGSSMRNRKGGNGIPKRHRAFGVDFGTEEEAAEFEREQNLLRDYVEGGYSNIEIYDKKEWYEKQPFRIFKGHAFAIYKYKQEEWDNRDWQNDPDRIKYLKEDFYDKQ